MIRKSNKIKADWIHAIGDAVQLYQESTEAFDDTAAEILGLNSTDMKCLGVIYRKGPVSAGEIAKATGLTRGAMTTALDRVEEAGYAQRTRDPHDRRGVLLALTPEGKEAIKSIWGGFLSQGEKMLSRYSLGQLEAILRFLEESRSAQDEQRVRLGRLKNEEKGHGQAIG